LVVPYLVLSSGEVRGEMSSLPSVNQAMAWHRGAPSAFFGRALNCWRAPSKAFQ